MTKSEVKNLEKRVRELDHQPSSTDDTAGAPMAWLFHHLTEQERFEVSTCVKRLETDQGDKEAEERMHGLLEKAQIRGDTRPASVREEFYRKHSRVEALRNVGGILTDAEHDELLALNAWSEKFRQEVLETVGKAKPIGSESEKEQDSLTPHQETNKSDERDHKGGAN